MNQQITFQDVGKNYHEARKYMRLNYELICSNVSDHPTWINPPTLARWLYDASREWFDSYTSACKKLIDQLGEGNQLSIEKLAQLGAWRGDLDLKLHDTETKLMQRYPSDKLLREALAA